LPEDGSEFSHSLHSDLDCRYCHNPDAVSDESTIAGTNVCMNCHKSENEIGSAPIDDRHNEEMCTYDPHRDYENNDNLLPEPECAKCHY
jgi:hypothetical protein